MDKHGYRRALGDAAASLRTERGYRSVAAFAKDTGLPESKIRRVEGAKEIEKGLTLATIETYCQALRITPGDLFTRADSLYERIKGLDSGKRGGLVVLRPETSDVDDGQ